MPAPHCSVFTGWMPFLPPNQRRQSKTWYWNGSSISQTTFKQSSPCSRQIMIPTSHHWIFKTLNTMFLGISWRDHITNDEVLRRTDLGNLSEIVWQRRPRFAGNILRLSENGPAYMAVNWQPDNGRRRPGRLTKTWQTTFNEDLHDMGLTWMGAKRSAGDRPKWRKLVARCSSRNWRN